MTSHFIWYELMTNDLDAAAEFYSAILDWEVTASDASGMDYRHFSAGGVQVGGLMALPPAAADMGMGPSFFGYVSVDDLDAAVIRISAAGGAVHMPAMDIPSVGRFAFVADPQGASFYVMTPIGEEGSATSFAPGQPGHGGWHELHTRDWEAALAFYSAQFGWAKVNAMQMGPLGTYLQFNTGHGDMIGGMLNDRDAAQPHWLYYFNVEEIQAARTRVLTHGGEALMEPHQVPTGDWIVQARDPQGALFALVGPRKD